MNWKNDESTWILVQHWLWQCLSQALCLVLRCRLLGWAIASDWNLEPTMLTMVVLYQLGAQLVNNSLALMVSWNDSSVLGELLRLGKLELNLLLAQMILIVVG